MSAKFEAVEVFAILGAPARIFGRLPLPSRYLWNGLSQNLHKLDYSYARARWGVGARWRIWLVFDIGELEMVEELLNYGSDRRVVQFRENQLRASQMVSIVVRCLRNTMTFPRHLLVLNAMHRAH